MFLNKNIYCAVKSISEAAAGATKVRGSGTGRSLSFFFFFFFFVAVRRGGEIVAKLNPSDLVKTAHHAWASLEMSV
jgi:hypothetical protein